MGLRLCTSRTDLRSESLYTIRRVHFASHDKRIFTERLRHYQRL